MFSLDLDSSKCVRAVTKFSTCDNCLLTCPTNAISFNSDNNLPNILPSSCVNCGGCVGSCPSEALSLDFHSNTDFFFDFVQEDESLLSCKKNLPCLAVLTSEHLLSMALLKEGVTFDVGHCKTCELKEPLYKIITDRVDEVNYLLEAMESDSRVSLKELAYEPPEGDITHNRREFLEQFSLKNALKQKEVFDKEVEIDPDEFMDFGLDSIDVSKIKNKQFPDKRKILFTALKRAKVPDTLHVLNASDLTFVSTKELDYDSCTACQMCYRICPTGALSTDYKNSKIDFDASMCIKCAVCHDVCEPKSITLSDTFGMDNFFKPSVKQLVKFKIRRCYECDSYFDYRGGEVICPRCKLEEDEAKELWGLN
ncbi:MAG: 4Fe-4S binding protein [Thiovulaceae bacterium]|nr:4Fe-4S binding protein [Sulfurimonadaceae bacterium]